MKKWFTVSMGEALLPRFKLTTDNRNFHILFAANSHNLYRFRELF